MKRLPMLMKVLPEMPPPPPPTQHDKSDDSCWWNSDGWSMTATGNSSGRPQFCTVLYECIVVVVVSCQKPRSVRQSWPSVLQGKEENWLSSAVEHSWEEERRTTQRTECQSKVMEKERITESAAALLAEKRVTAWGTDWLTDWTVMSEQFDAVI